MHALGRVGEEQVRSRALPAGIGFRRNARRYRRRRWRPAGHRSAHAAPRRRRNDLPAHGMRDAHPAQPDMIARGKAVHIKTLSRCVLRATERARLSAMAKSSAVVSLRCWLRFRTSVTAKPAHSATAASSVRLDSCCGRGFVGSQDVCETEPLRGLRPPKIRPLEGLGDAPCSSARFKVSRQRHGGDAPPEPAAGPASTRSMFPAVTNGRTASWIKTRSGACGSVLASRCERGLSGLAARQRRRQACRKVAVALSYSGQSAARSPPARSDRREIQERVQSPAEHGAGTQGGILLGQWRARPRPRPAATISAAVFKAAPLVVGGWPWLLAGLASLTTANKVGPHSIRACEGGAAS